MLSCNHAYCFPNVFWTYKTLIKVHVGTKQKSHYSFKKFIGSHRSPNDKCCWILSLSLSLSLSKHIHIHVCKSITCITIDLILTGEITLQDLAQNKYNSLYFINNHKIKSLKSPILQEKCIYIHEFTSILLQNRSTTALHMAKQKYFSHKLVCIV